MQFEENSATILNDFVSKLLPYANIDDTMKTEGRSKFVILSPKKVDKKAGVPGGVSSITKKLVTSDVLPVEAHLDIPPHHRLPNAGQMNHL